MCIKAAPKVAAFFAERNEPLLYHTITEDYYSVIPGLPALVLRQPVFNTDTELILVGADIPDYLEKLALEAKTKNHGRNHTP